MPELAPRAISLKLPCVLALLLLISSSAFAQGAANPDDLVSRYKTAFASQDVRAYMALVSPTTGADSAIAESQFRTQAAASRMISARRVPLSTYQAQFDRAIRDGLTPTIKPIGWVVVEYETVTLGKGATMQLTAIMIFGLRNGRYYFGS